MTAINELIIQRTAKVLTQNHEGVGEVAQHIIDGTLQRTMRESHIWVMAAIKVLRAAPNATWTDDESAARSILDKLFAKYPNLQPRAVCVPPKNI